MNKKLTIVLMLVTLFTFGCKNEQAPAGATSTNADAVGAQGPKGDKGDPGEAFKISSRIACQMGHNEVNTYKTRFSFTRIDTPSGDVILTCEVYYKDRAAQGVNHIPAALASTVANLKCEVGYDVDDINPITRGATFPTWKFTWDDRRVKYESTYSANHNIQFMFAIAPTGDCDF